MAAEGERKILTTAFSIRPKQLACRQGFSCCSIRCGVSAPCGLYSSAPNDFRVKMISWYWNLK